MRRVAFLTTAVLIFISAIPVAAQDKGGGLGGVLDTLGSVLGGGARKIHGTVVLTDGSTLVLRGDDRRTYRVDTASLDPGKRAALRPGQVVTVTARGGGQAGVLTANDVQSDAAGSATTFSTVSGTVQEGGAQRVLFKTRDGLVLPVDVTQITGLPYLAPEQPATLYYEHGKNQQIVGVWIQPGAAQPAASPTTTSAPAREPEALQGLVESIGISDLRLQTSDGRTISVDTQGVDRQALGMIRPGDVVTVMGRASSAPDRFVAQSIQSRR